jgi:hypothetical protein
MKTVSTLLLTVLLSCLEFAGESCKADEAAANVATASLVRLKRPVGVRVSLLATNQIS